MLPAKYLNKKLTKPLPIKGGPVLLTIGDVADYVLSLPDKHVAANNAWQHTAKLNLDQADTAKVNDQIRLALFLDMKLDLIAMPK
jgi:hypothetical protein